MNRIQIDLEKWQYEVLRAKAELDDRSISDLVCEILRETLIQSGRGRLQEMEGVGTDSVACGRSHDRFLFSN